MHRTTARPFGRFLFRTIPLAALALLLAIPAQAATWNIDPDHSAAHFSIQHMMIAKVRGAFHGVSGTVSFENGRPAAFDVTIAVDSLDTGVDARDKHLKSPDFFEAATYPTMTFQSTRVVPEGDAYKLIGTLTIKGVSKEITATLTGFGTEHTDPWNNVRRGGEARFQIDRRDHNIVWNAPLEGGGIMVGNAVDIAVDIEAIEPK